MRNSVGASKLSPCYYWVNQFQMIHRNLSVFADQFKFAFGSTKTALSVRAGFFRSFFFSVQVSELFVYHCTIPNVILRLIFPKAQKAKLSLTRLTG